MTLLLVYSFSIDAAEKAISEVYKNEIGGTEQVPS